MVYRASEFEGIVTGRAHDIGFWDWAMFAGTIGLFVTAFLLFIRFLPMISIFEMRTLLPEAEVKEELA